MPLKIDLLLILFCIIFQIIAAQNSNTKRPLEKQLTLTEGDKNTIIPCRSNSLVPADIKSCKFEFFKKYSVEPKPGVIQKTLCTITVADFEDFRDVNTIKCNITVLDVNEVPVVYTVVMNPKSKFPVVEVAIGAGVVGGAILIGVASYLIIKFKTKKPPGLLSLKDVDGAVPRPENARYVTQPSLQQGPPRTKQDDDFIIPPVVVAPLPGRKKKRTDKDKIPQSKSTFEDSEEVAVTPSSGRKNKRKYKDQIPQAKPTFEDSEEGEYEEIGILPLKRGPTLAQPPPINLASLPRELPNQKRSKSPKIIQSSTLEHKKPRPQLPSKPRSGTMQANVSRAPAESNKKKPIGKVLMQHNFLGELNQKLAKTPNGFTPITVRPTNLQDNDDDASYEGIDFTNDHTGSREMTKPLIEDRRPPAPFPKPKKSNKDKLIEKPKKPETGTKGPETLAKLGKPILPKAVTAGTQVLAEIPVLKPIVPVKTVYSGKPTEESPNEKVKGKWKPNIDNIEKKGPTVGTKPLGKAFGTNQTSNKPPLPQSQVDNISHCSSYESVSSDEETNFRLPQQARKLPMPPPEGDNESQKSYESSASNREPESASSYRQNKPAKTYAWRKEISRRSRKSKKVVVPASTRVSSPGSKSRFSKSDKTYDELSSGDEWNDFDYIKVEPHKYNPGSNPVQKASSNENMYYEPVQPYSREAVGSNLAQSNTTSVQNGVNSAKSGASSIPGGINSAKSGASSIPGGINSAKSGASSIPGGINSAKSGASSIPGGINSVKSGSKVIDRSPQARPGKGVKNKPLPPLPRENEDIYENVEEFRPTIHYKGAKY